MDSDDCLLVFFVNGRKISLKNPNPEETLVYYLRDKCGLKGTKVGCAVGGCGACTVMISEYKRTSDRVSHYTVNACLMPVVALHGLAVTTVEGIGSSKTRLHLVQERLAKSHGTQCGFCSPGMVMSMYTLLRNYPQPSQADIEQSLAGNLCRCTGYRPIVEGFRSFTEPTSCPMGDQCCQNRPEATPGGDNSETGADNTTYDQTQEPIFPPQLKMIDFGSEYKHFCGPRVDWYRPSDLDSLLRLKQSYPEAKVVCGNISLGIGVHRRDDGSPSVVISTSHMPSLQSVCTSDEGIWFGGCVTISEMSRSLQSAVSQQPEHETSVYRQVLQMLASYGSEQIRNVSSIAGNIMTRRTVSDLHTIYLAAGSKIRLRSAGKDEREIAIVEKLFADENQLANYIQDDEIICSILIPKSSKTEFFFCHKQSMRGEFDFAVVNAAMRVKFDSQHQEVEEMALAYSGLGSFAKLCSASAKQLIKRTWDDSLLENGISLLREELYPLINNYMSRMEYKRALVTSLFYKFYLQVKDGLERMGKGDKAIEMSEISAVTPMERVISKGIQVYSRSDDLGHSQGDCWKPVPHKSAELHTTGEAQYVEDLPAFRDEVFVSMVTSTIAHGKILSIDPTEALACAGVRDFFCAKDIRGVNKYCITEQLFATDEVTCVGHLIGAVVADTKKLADEAAAKVKVQYEELPAIQTIEDAIEANSFLTSEPVKLSNGDVEEGFSKSDFILTGEITTGGQNHFYMETQSAVSVPKENGELEVYSSTQGASQMHVDICTVLKLPQNKVNVKVKRIGGAFGGKESRSALVTLPVCMASQRLNKPARCTLTREQDMRMMGGRHPYLAKYKVGYNKDGSIVSIKVTLYSNGGNSMDSSRFVMITSVLRLENGYCVPNIMVEGNACRTNTLSNMAFRGFGAPEAMFVMEIILEQVAAELNMPALEIRQKHLNKDGDVLIHGQVLKGCNLQKCWDQVMGNSDYHQRLANIQIYNKDNRWRKRGISCVPTRFGIAVYVDFKNQAGALVNIYTDGTVLVSSGGNEMGQGLHTKLIQVASQALGIPEDKIHTLETSTNTVPNHITTGGSTGSDLNGRAVMDACAKLNERLEPIKKANPTGSWEQLISAAYFSRISLSATGYFRHETLDLNWTNGIGSPNGKEAYPYFTYGAAVSEVEIDCLTGEHQVLRTDIVMDVGKSLNPAIDIGQIEGGFIQGYGYFCLEDVIVDDKTGEMLTASPESYKIPTLGCIPREFNVELLKESSNDHVHSVYSSKGIGEPPLFLAASVFFAIKSAIESAREDSGKSRKFRLDSPATADKIRLSCADQFTQN